METKNCSDCSSEDLTVVFGHACPFDIRKGYRPDTVVPHESHGNPTGVSTTRGGNGLGASDKQVAFLVKLGMDEAAAKKLGKKAASDEIEKRLAEQPKQAWTPSEKQVAFMTSLLSQKLPEADAADFISKMDSQKKFSENIDALKAMKAVPARKIAEQATDDATEISDGFYVWDEQVYKVQRAVHGSGNLYAKLMDEDGHFNFMSGAIFKLTKAVKAGEAERLTLARAKELGHLYGRCMVCGRTLTDEQSIADGIGPVCATKF